MKNEILNKFIEFSNFMLFTQIEESKLIRNDAHLFTFSPVLDIEKKYIGIKNEVCGYKIQECFRQVFPINLFNPLAIPYQRLYSLHIFKRVNKLDIIEKFISDYLINKLNLDLDKIFIISPNNDIKKIINNDIKTIKNKIIVIDKDRLSFKIPAIQGKHYYIKIVYGYNNGLITLANFAVLDYSNQNFMIDSVIFEKRIECVIQKKDFIFQISEYENIYGILLKKCNNKHNIVHLVISNYIAFLRIYGELGKLGNKRHAYITKKLLVDIFNILYYYKIDFDDKFINILINNFECEINKLDLEKIIIMTYNKFINNINKYKFKCEKILQKEKSNINIIENIHSTYGISKYVLFRLFPEYFYDEIYNINNDNKNNFAYKFNFNEHNFFNEANNYK